MVPPKAILSYGEDSLTFWALTRSLGRFLSKLGDKTDQNKALVIYRPSFGRGVGASGSRLSATFGEFDAIVATEKAVYLVEAKWHRSSEVRGGVVLLSEIQSRRHEVFRWYRSNLTPSRRANWNQFKQNHDNQFTKRFLGLCLPPKDSVLRQNLCFVLEKLDSFPPCTKDVLLYLGPASGKTQPPVGVVSVKPNKFILICLQFSVLGGAGYFEMT